MNENEFLLRKDEFVVRDGLQISRFVKQEAKRQQKKLQTFLKDVGYSANVFQMWENRGGGPNVPGSVAMLQELGYELRVVRKGAPEFAQNILKELENENV